MTKEKVPWDETVLYQVYPWSFKEDEERDPQLGNGSIKGIIEKLPYLIDLGVDAIWVSPPYPGPMKDAGYDISNFVDIHPDLGTLEDFDDLVAQCHENGMRVMLDYIPNHSSDQHEWFEKSRNSEEGFEDWYIWHEGKLDENGNRVPPNNWGSVFSKPNRKARDRGEMPHLRDDEHTPTVSAWQWDDVRSAYYLRMFVKEQPDLNWGNEKVVEAMLDNMRFWFDRGVDGLRMDAVNHMAKNYELPDEELNPHYDEKYNDNPFEQLNLQHSSNHRPEFYKQVRRYSQVPREERYKNRDLRLLLESYVSKDLLREINNIDPEISSTFNFEAFRMEWNALKRKEQLDSYFANHHNLGLPNHVNGNHDNQRLATRLGDAAARSVAVLTLFLPGMRIIYNGEELGLHDGVVPPERVQDPNGLRDSARTPPIWDHAKPNAGFSKAAPEKLWLPINEADLELSVLRQLVNPKSSLSLYGAAIRLCRELPAVRGGKYVPLQSENESVLTYGRRRGNDKAVVMVNFSSENQRAATDLDFALGKTVLSSIDVTQNLRDVSFANGVELRPDEALVIVPS